MKKKFLSIAAIAAATALFAGCAAAGYSPEDPSFDPPDVLSGGMFDFGQSGGNYQYESILEQGFCNAREEPASYFSLDRNTANYSQVRAQINTGREVASDSVRIEELVNYFSYDFPEPDEGEFVRASAYLSPCPWKEENRLLTVGIRTEERKLVSELNNYVLLIDVSGSMSAGVTGLQHTTVMDLVKTGIEELVGGLSARDRVSIVTYASGVKLQLEPTAADPEGKEQILKVARSLIADGATNGSGGLELAYEQAEKFYSQEGNNRVVLMTDGDFNVGISNVETLKQFVKGKAQSGVYLSVLGFGMGNMRDDLMQSLALNGNGNYAYIDTPQEAKKTLGEELTGTLVTVAKNAKAGVTFNEEAVSSYRLLGYDMKRISEDDFNNSEKDTGEIGSDLTVVVVYELALNEGIAVGERLAEIAVRYQTADGKNEDREETAIAANTISEQPDLPFISCVLEFGLVLRNSEYRGQANLASVLKRLEEMQSYLASDFYKSEFKEIVQKAIASEYYD